MVLNESAYYNGKRWYAYELKNSAGVYKEELRLSMRKESQNHKFTCPDCSEELILCAGPIMEPFFKHHENTKCPLRSEDSNKRNFSARRMLFHLAKQSFPQGDIEVNRKIGDNTVADFLITMGDTKIALQYLGYEIKLDQWEEKHEDFLYHDIIDVWFLNYKKYQNEISTTFEYLLSKNTKVVKLIDYENNVLILKEKIIIPGIEGLKFIAKEYTIDQLTLNLKGELECDYEEFKTNQLQVFLEDENLRKQSKLEYEARIVKEQEEHRLEMLQQSIKREEKRLLREEIAMKKMTSDSPVPYRFLAKREGSVIRRSISEDNITKLTMKMQSIGELWDLPELTGKDWMVKKSNNNRYIYMRNVNQELALTMDEKKRELMISRAIITLENNIDASLWK